MTASPTVTGTATGTWTPLPSATPAEGEVVRFSLPDLRIYQRPGGPIIGNLLPSQKVTILYGK